MRSPWCAARRDHRRQQRHTGGRRVITANDLAAIGVLDGLLRAGVSVPDDLSVVGYDDSRFARLHGIDLTSVRQDIPRMAELAVQAVVERLDGPPRVPRTVALAPRLVVRGTTAP